MADYYQDAGTLDVSTSKNVGFKLGTSQKLKDYKPFKAESAGGLSATPGCFYLTSDTHKLYIGNDNGTLSPVNQGINFIDNINNLPIPSADNKSAYSGHFYYCATPGVLAVFNGEKWVQVNPDTFIEKEGFYSSTSQGVVTLSHGSVDNNTVELTSKVNFTGTGNISVSSTASPNSLSTATPTGKTQTNIPTITITGKEYELKSGAVTNNSVDINYTEKNSDTALSSVTLKGGQNVTLTKNGDSVEISAKDDDTKISSFASENLSTTDGGFKFTITSSDTNAKSATIIPKIKYGENTSDSGDNRSIANFVNGIATLDVYSKADIEDKLKALNAMTYRGTIGSSTSTFGEGFNSTTKFPKGSNQISVGDVFLVDQMIEANDSFNGQAIPAQSLIIARGTEDSAGFITQSTLAYDVVAPTADVDTKYFFSSSTGTTGNSWTPSSTNTQKSVKIELKGDVGNANGGYVQINKGDGIEIRSTSTTGTGSSFSNNQTTIDIAHVNYGTVTGTTGTAQSMSDVTAQSHSKTLTIPAITDITLTNGHVTGYTTTNYTVTNSESYIDGYTSVASASAPSGAANQNVVGLQTQLSSKTGNGSGSPITATSAVTSDSLTLSATSVAAGGLTGVSGVAYGVKIDLAWGSF